MQTQKIRFSETLKHRYVDLDEAASVNLYAAFVRKSVDCLDLRISEKLHPGGDSSLFINTEEKLRKVFAPSRALLYKLHLDLPQNRELSLKNGQSGVEMTCQSNIPHIGEIIAEDEFYFYEICRFIEHALVVNEDKLKILELIFKIPLIKRHYLRADTDVMNIFANIFCNESTDSVLQEKFIASFNILRWMTYVENPKALSYFLYRIRIEGEGLEKRGADFGELVFHLIIHNRFLNIVQLFDYIDKIRFSSETAVSYMDIVSLRWIKRIKEAGPPYPYSDDLFIRLKRDTEEGTGGMDQERICLMFLTIFIFMFRRYENGEAPAETLRILWNTSSKAGLTIEELKKAFPNVEMGLFRENELSGLFHFYKSSVGEEISDSGLRTLKHLCRCRIRRTLGQKKIWIPDLIEQLPLPKSIKMYLNLKI